MYSGVFVFGDSLVDAGNALKLANWYGNLPLSHLPEGAPTTEAGYFNGRFSNGYTFADLLANKLVGSVTQPVFPFGYEDPWLGVPLAPFAGDPSGNTLNFAYGGAQIRQGDEVVPDFDGQTDAFRDAVDGDADPNALYLITFGGNDVRNLVLPDEQPVPEADAHQALDLAADKMLTELSQLFGIGATNFVITGIPDVGLIPNYDDDGNRVLDAAELARSEAATAYSQYLDVLIRTEVIPALEALGATVTYVPLMDYVDANGDLVEGALTANLPTIAALHGLTTEELSDNLLAHQELVFVDEIHPNAQANALLGAFMLAQVNGTPWVETLPLTSADVDYGMTATIAAVGEIDTVTVSLVAGTTYTFEMLGVSSLGAPGSLGDPTLRLLGPGGTSAGADDDSGAGFDATLTFTAAVTGTYTVELDAVGSLTGFYSFHAAVIDGAAMQAGNVYVVSNAATVILEGAGGVGDDVAVARVSYALSAGSEIEVMTTVNSSAATAINLTGNELAQSIYGNAGDNLLTGLGGADYLVGGLGNDWYYVDTSDFIAEANGGGDDMIVVATSYILREGNEIETLVAWNQDSVDSVNLTGNEYGQSLYGSQGANSLNGGAGNDYLVGLGGNDFLLGGEGNDNLDGGAGNDVYYVDSGDQLFEASGQGEDIAVAFASFTLNAGAHVETLSAAEGNAAINLTGNELAQTLFGNAGANVLNGGGGNDYLIGGAGNDRFVFMASPGNDTIADFVSGSDKLDLTAFGITQTDVQATTSNGNTSLAVDTNDDGTADFTITLVGAGAPVAGDYLF